MSDPNDNRFYREKEKARPLSEWCEDHGDVLWWEFPITGAPYVGSPLDLGYEVVSETTVATVIGQETKSVRFWVCGWPGYHTHWTPLPEPPEEPKS